MSLDGIIRMLLGLGGSVSVPISKTGYSTAADIAAAVSTLEHLQLEAISMFPADPLPGGKWRTKCNFSVQHVCGGVGCHDTDNLMATQMVRHLADLCSSRPEEWREDSLERGAAHSQKGGITIYGMEAPAGEAHGHVVTGAPKPMEQSGSWGCLVPVVCNVGKPSSQGIVRLSQAFRAEDRYAIRTFLWKPNA